MNNARQEYTQQVRSLFSLCNAEPFLDGSTTPLQLAKDYAEVGEDCGLTLDEAVEIIDAELEPYKDQLLNDLEEELERIQYNEEERREALNATAKEQARKLLGKYKWTAPQRRRLEQQAEKGYIVASHGEIAKVFSRIMPNNADDIATYRIGWLGSKIAAKKRLNFTC